MPKKKDKKVPRKKVSIARAASPKTRFTLKTAAEFQELVVLSTKLKSEGAELGACWFSDSGNPDQCVPLTEAECKNQGGTWTPGECPNTFLVKSTVAKRN
jgi:hypothetical protein